MPAAFSRPPDVPNWSNPALEDHKGNRLSVVGSADFFAKGTKTFFGDLHVHTNYSRCGRPNNLDLPDKLAWVRRETKHDFVAVADHAEHMSDADYAEYCRVIDSADSPGAFVTLPAYEWAGRAHPTTGHRNVMFRDGFGPIFRGTEPPTMSSRGLGEALRRLNVPAIAPRHHTTYHGSWDSFAPDLEPVVEIYSSWGNSEHEGCAARRPEDGNKFPLPGNWVQDGLTRGCVTGFVGGGDAHNIMPGTCGLTGVIAESLTRGAVWDAIRARRCYATTGPRILLDFSVNGHPMGSVLRLNKEQWPGLYPLKIACGVIGTGPLQKLELIENNRVIFTQTLRRGPSNEMACAFNQPASGHIYYGRYYYARVTQSDGEMAWSSPVWFLFSDGNEA